ncbi:MAG TPA: TlpA disulfide reductase family protein [Bryobacteraceae bacterium]|nr:TlpA disulfide reductase family protein [Bryobacteraceae bacterium]
MRVVWRAAAVIAAFSTLLCFGGQVSVPPSYGQPATPRIVLFVQAALQQGDLAQAAALVAQYRRLNGDTPEALEALSWLARGQLAFGHPDEAQKEADEIERSATASLATRSLDKEPHLPIALGAAYEIQAGILNDQHKKTEAVQLLETQMRKWHGTSIVSRLQKNLNLLTLQGKPMPPLKETEWIGAKPVALTSLRGKVLLVFFWAHWCADCKADAPIIAKLAQELGPKGLVVIAPTQRYGYTAEEEHASPAVETPFIDKVYAHYYAGIPNAGVPLDPGNFERFGVSTTPTIVLVDRRGIVRLYHPGAMDEKALRAAIGPLLAAPAQLPQRAAAVTR